MANIVTNKPTTAEDFYSPFTPAKAVDGVISPINRWISSRVPTSLTVDLQANYYVSQWILSFMGCLNGWKDYSSRYNMSDFMLQGSLDNTNWFNLDSVNGNTDNQINKSFSPKLTRYLKIKVTKGLNCNNKVASIVDFQAFESPNAPYLSVLAPNIGALSPAFSSHTLTYTVNVDNVVSNIKFTPTALQSNMTIKVNGTAVISGQQSQQINLLAGSNKVTIEVTSADNTMTTKYTVDIVRAGLAFYLSSLDIRDDSGDPVGYSPALSHSGLKYSASISSAVMSIQIKPMAEETTATVKVNDVIVNRGSWSDPVPMYTGTNTVNILVNSTWYELTINKW